ncbi:MAG: (2Fe-2S) ferredoxin domain-containing protein [Oscillospiraceae bacterium]
MIEICVCVGSSCHLKGSYPIIEELKRLIAIEKLENFVELRANFCTGDCINGVCMEINGEKIKNVAPKDVKDLFYTKILPAK